MKIKTSWVFGQFKVTASTEVETAEPVGPRALALMEMGFLQVLQRTPSSAAEKAVAGYTKRPADFKRGDIPWSDENALKLVEGFGTQVNLGSKDEPDMMTYSIEEVVQHVPNEKVSSRVQATNMAAQLAPAMLPLLGLTTESTDEERIEACHGFLAKMTKKAPAPAAAAE